MLRYFAGVIKVMLLTSPKGERAYIYMLSRLFDAHYFFHSKVAVLPFSILADVS